MRGGATGMKLHELSLQFPGSRPSTARVEARAQATGKQPAGAAKRPRALALSGGGVVRLWRPDASSGTYPSARICQLYFATKYATINVSDLNKFGDGAVIDTASGVGAGL